MTQRSCDQDEGCSVRLLGVVKGRPRLYLWSSRPKLEGVSYEMTRSNAIPETAGSCDVVESEAVEAKQGTSGCFFVPIIDPSAVIRKFAVS